MIHTHNDLTLFPTYTNYFPFCSALQDARINDVIECVCGVLWFSVSSGEESVSPQISSVYRQHERISLCLRLCSKLQIQSKMDSAYLLESLAGNFMDVVQYNEDNRGFEVCELETMDRVHVVRHATL